MPDEKDIMELIKSSVVNLDINQLNHDSRLSDHGMDSMDKMNLLLLIEQKYRIKISDEEAKKLDSVDSIAEFISSRT
jgi:acyl carrier protein